MYEEIDVITLYQLSPQPDLVMTHSSHLPAIHPGLLGLSPVQYFPTGQQVFSPLVMNDMFFTGFSDCAGEALRYLVDVEGLPPNDPMVLGLKQHLYEKQRLLELDLLLRNRLQLTSLDSVPDVHAEANLKHEHCETIGDSNEPNTDSETICKYKDSVADLTMKANASIAAPERSEMDHINENNSSEIDVPKKVADLVNELFSLLQEEENDMYLESDSEMDEGFDEIIEQEVVL